MQKQARIEYLCKQLVSLTPQLNKLEKIPVMVPLKLKPSSSAAGSPGGAVIGGHATKHKHSTVASTLTSASSSIMGYVSQLYSRIVPSSPTNSTAVPQSAGERTKRNSFSMDTDRNLTEKVQSLVSELEETVMEWLDDWRTIALNTEPTKFSRPPSSPLTISSNALYDEDKGHFIAPYETLIAVYTRLMDLISNYQYYLKYVDCLLAHCLPVICEYLQLFALKCTCAHWFYLPTIRLKNTVNYPSSENGTSDSLPPLQYVRHAVDERYVDRELYTHGKRNQHIMDILNRFHEAAVGQSKHLMDSTDSFSAKLTATYPMVPRSQSMNANMTLSGNEDPAELVLLNDPNNDGYLTVFGKGWICGATVDGSGAGYHAHLAGNIMLATMYDMIFGDTASDSSPLSKFSLKQMPWKTTHDCCNFMEKVMRKAHKNMIETDECGSTTCIMYTMTEASQDDFDFYHSKSQKFQEKFKGAETMYVLNYLICGDAEGYHYSSHDKHWRSLHEPPAIRDHLRLNTSITPGGLGKRRGTADKIYGTYLWPDFIELKSRTDKADWVEFHAVRTNMHFGQILMHESDFVIAATDGFGDTIDPVQIFPLPRLILGLEEYNGWNHFAESFPSPTGAIREMKEMILNRLLASTLEPFEQHTEVTTHDILESCVNHSMHATSEDRNLYHEPEFIAALRMDKQKIMHNRILEWIDKNWPRRLSEMAGRHFAIPDLFVPFAKVDHLGIQVVSPRAIPKHTSVLVKQETSAVKTDETEVPVDPPATTELPLAQEIPSTAS